MSWTRAWPSAASVDHRMIKRSAEPAPRRPAALHVSTLFEPTPSAGIRLSGLVFFDVYSERQTK